MYSDTIGEQLAAALAELQTQLPHIEKPNTAIVKGKTKTGADFEYTYKFEKLSEVSEAILPLLGKLGMAWVTRPTINDKGDFVLAYTLAHISGDSTSGEWPLPKGASQDMGGAVTYARRYCLCAVTGLAPVADDDDAAAAAAAASRQRRTRPKPEQGSDGPTGITGDQMAKMQALFTEMKLTEREDKLRYAREVIGPTRDIGSATELTKVEASKVIAKLTSWAAQETPPAESAVA
jgi:hypothetical protein